MPDLASLYIKIDSSGVVTASKDLAGLEGQSRKVETATESVQSKFASLTGIVQKLAAAYAMLKLSQYVQEVTMLAARYETLGVVMRVVGNNAGYTGAQMETFAKGLEKTGISMTESRQSITRMVQAQLDLNKSSQLARVAQDAAVIGNINSSEAFQRLVYGIQSAQTEMLRTIGINVSFEAAYQKVADTTGRTANSFSETEKANIRMNAVLENGKMIAGAYEGAMDTAGKQVLSLQRHLDNLKVLIGGVFTPALAEIIETITGAITDLNGNLSGEGKKAIEEWGVKFRITIIEIEAEITRFAMFLDKVGGSLTTMQMLLTGPGNALGIESSTKRFQAAADNNMMYEKRYYDSEQSLIKLADKQIKLEYSMTDAGKAATKAVQDAAEAKILANRKIEESIRQVTAAEKKAAEEARRLIESWGKTSDRLKEESSLAGLEGSRRDFQQNLIEAEKLKKEYVDLPPALRATAYAQIEVNKVMKDAGVITLATIKSREENAKAMEKEQKEYDDLVDKINTLEASYSPIIAAQNKYLEQIKDIQSALEKGVIGKPKATDLTAQAGLGKDTSIAKSSADYYSQVVDYAQVAYEKKLALIELERQANIKLYGDISAANAKANQDAIAALNTKISAEQKGTRDIISGYNAMIDTALTCYALDSKEYGNLQDLKKAGVIAEQLMNVAKNAQIISSNLGLVASNTAVAMSNAGAAVTGAAIGVGPTGFATAAAMTALLSSVFAIYGLAGGGFSSASTSTPAVSLPASTVLGAEAGTDSESISKSWKLMQDTYDMEYQELSGIHSEMKDLNDNITGLVKSIILTGGITSAGMQTMIGGKGDMENMFLEIASFVDSSISPILGVFGSLGDMLGGLLGGISSFVGSIVGGIFGGGTSYRYTDVGVELGSKTIKALIAGESLTGRTYRDVREVTDGGWFSDDTYSYYRQYGQLDNSVTDMFTKVFKNLSATLVSMAEGLGEDVNKTLNYNLSLGQLPNLSGQTSDALNKTINAWISQISDTAVNALFGNMLKVYQQVGEGMYETAGRLLIDKVVVLNTLKTTGMAFVGTTKEAIALSESLILIAGGLDILRENAEKYYDKFFTDAEKQINLQNDLTAALSNMQMVLPTARQGYRDLVEGLDLTTETGRKAYVTMLSLADYADQYYTTLEDMAKQAADTAATLAEELAQKLQDAINKAMSAVDAQISLSQTAAITARTAAESYRGIIETLIGAQNKIRGGGESSNTASIFALAMTGDQAALKALPGAIDEQLAASLKTAKSAEDYARDQGKALIQLEQAKMISTAMVNWEEYQATLLETQVNVLEQIRDELALENPNLEALERQAGLLESIGGLLQQQTTAIISGNGQQVLLMHDQNGIITAANVLTTTQTGQVAIGNSWLEKIKGGVKIESAAVINDYLQSVEQGLSANNSAEAQAARNSIAVLRQTTADGLLTTAEAKTTTAAITALQSSTANLLAQEVQAQQATMSAASKQAADAVLATSKVAAAIAAGVNINSAVTIGQYLDEVASAIAANNSAEANQARTAIAELKTATSSGLASTATASATVAALNTLKATTATILNQSVALEQYAMYATSNQASSALSAALATKDLINLQKAEIINGNLIIKDQNGLIVSGNQLLVDQTGKITIGNTMTGEQTAQVITGNATQDAIKAISGENKSYSEQMLGELARAGSTQTSSLADIVTQTALTVAAIQQLIQLTADNLAEQEAATARAEADRLAAVARAEADRLAAVAAEEAIARAAEARAAIKNSALAAYNEIYAAEGPAHQIAYNDPAEVAYHQGRVAAALAYYESLPNAMGNAFYSGNVIPFANGGIFNTPTLFPMANGMGLMGEAGPEAIMPLSRSPGGKLGVRADGNVIQLDELRKIRASIEAGNLANVKNTAKMARILQRFDDDGMPAERVL